MDRQPADGGVAEAMNRVLAAERAALAEVEACRQEADRILEAARREAQGLLERSERVARDIHARTGHAAHVHAILNNLIIGLLHRHKPGNMAQGVREMTYQIENLLLQGCCT